MLLQSNIDVSIFLLIFYVPKLLLHQKNDVINFKAKKGDLLCPECAVHSRHEMSKD